MKNQFTLTTAGILLALGMMVQACGQAPQPARQQQEPAGGSDVKQSSGHRFLVLDPGHFHAALVFKPAGYAGVSDLVGVYAPVGDDFVDHMARVTPFNTREQDPAQWRYHISLGPDYQENMLNEKFGDIAVLSGRNQPKIDRILACVQGGLNVLADKPWVIDRQKLPVLEKAIQQAQSSGRVIQDIMTERYEVTTIIQRMIVNDEATFGELIRGTPENPALHKQSVHHLYKLVAGKPNKRPWWFFDEDVQGEGLVDVTTHLVDMSLWTLFPNEPVTRDDIEMISAEHWPTLMTAEQFEKVTRLEGFPPQFDLDSEGRLPYYSNGKMVYRAKGHVISHQVVWNFQAPEGSGDTHYSIIKGSRAHVLVRQGSEQNYRPEVFVRVAPDVTPSEVEGPLGEFISRVDQGAYPGVKIRRVDAREWHVDIPDKYRVGHEAHFGQVTQQFLKYLDGEPVPEWEYENLLTKYHVTTSALEMAGER